MKHKPPFALIFMILFSCTTTIDKNTYDTVLKTGNEVSVRAQAALLSHVGSAIQKGGPEYALEFCNLNASRIIDSLNQVYNCTIQRKSAKPRNPNAALSGSVEQKIWQQFAQNISQDTIIKQDGKLVYYKAIKIAMPACLKCHGDVDQDINTTTRNKLRNLYPQDLATGYSLGDFRGLWKIEFQPE